MLDVTICVVPAAGRGTRWAPVSGYLPKEILPLVDKPVIEWVIKEAVSSGCRKVIVVINKQKENIRKYLLSKKDLLKKAELKFVYQEKPLGIAHALFLSKNIIGQNPFALALPDLPTISRSPILEQLIKVFKNYNQSHVVSFSIFPPQTRQFYSECLLEKQSGRLFRLKHFCPKASNPHHKNEKLRMSGRYIFTNQIFLSLKQLMSNLKSHEVTDVDVLKRALFLGQRIIGLSIEGHTYDTGSPQSYVRANTAFFKKSLKLV